MRFWESFLVENLFVIASIEQLKKDGDEEWQLVFLIISVGFLSLSIRLLSLGRWSKCVIDRSRQMWMSSLWMTIIEQWQWCWEVNQETDELKMKITTIDGTHLHTENKWSQCRERNNWWWWDIIDLSFHHCFRHHQQHMVVNLEVDELQMSTIQCTKSIFNCERQQQSTCSQKPQMLFRIHNEPF